MTAQFEEKLRYKGKNLVMFNTPLEDYFEKHGGRPEPTAVCSASWRGYIGSWKIKRDRLYLTAIEKPIATVGEDENLLRSIFPLADGEVFADWFTGTLRIPQGKELEYVHMGFQSIYERELLIEVEAGHITSVRDQHNERPSRS